MDPGKGQGRVAGDGLYPRRRSARRLFARGAVRRRRICNKGIVVVTLNYRLGILGFFAHPELTKESRYHASGNYGLLDQNAALRWVHRNIAAFGGDPNEVTIFGQSGGAFSVTAQVVSPLSKGLFRAAIVESGGVGSGFARTELVSSIGEEGRDQVAPSAGESFHFLSFVITVVGMASKIKTWFICEIR